MKDFIYKYLNDNKEKIKILVQIGGNDGVQDDFIRQKIIEYKFETYILEPIEKYYKELTENYKDFENVTTCNYAITNKTGTDFINYIETTDEDPLWLKGCSSFYMDKNVLSGYGSINMKEVMPASLMNNIRRKTKSLEVKTLTFEDFIKLYSINNIDVLVTDTEGYDLNILKQINFKDIQPKLIILEYHNYSEEEKREIFNILLNNDYKIYYDGGMDLVGYR